MKKVFVVLCALSAAHSSYAEEILTEQRAGQEEFQRFDEPYKTVSGAFWGVGLGAARTQHKVDFAQGNSEERHHSSSALQAELSLLMGFGAPFHGRCYAGLEFELFRRFSGKTRDYDDQLHIHHCMNMSFNFDARFGYLFPKNGNLIFLTAGVSRVFGRVSFEKDKKPESSFGSFFPAVGCGIEHKINSNWNVRADCRYVISSRDNEHEVIVNRRRYRYKGKANRAAVRFAVTRSINTSFF